MSIININYSSNKNKNKNKNSEFIIWAILICKGFYLTLYLQMFSCVYIYVSLMCLMTTEDREVCQIFWSRSLWTVVSHHAGTENQTRVPNEQQVILATEVSLQPQLVFLIN